jgi:hypothetical protein
MVQASRCQLGFSWVYPAYCYVKIAKRYNNMISLSRLLFSHSQFVPALVIWKMRGTLCVYHSIESSSRSQIVPSLLRKHLLRARMASMVSMGTIKTQRYA